MTEKVSFQKDAGEPALSPDGKFLYYSKDVTPSPTFEYDKNPHAGIYAIIRRELATGRERIDRQRRRRRDHAARLARREVAGVHPPHRHRQPAVRPQPRDRRRAADLRAPGQGSAGGLDDLRPLRAVRVDARHQGAGGVGRREDLAGRSAGGPRPRPARPCRPAARSRSSPRSSRRSPRRSASR